MNISRVILLIVGFNLCKGETQTSTVPDFISNDINSDGITSRQASYGLVRFEGQLDINDDPGDRRPQLYTGDDRPNNRPLKFEDDVTSYTNQNNLNPSSTAENVVSFKDDTNYNTNGNTFNQIPGPKKRRKRRRRKFRQFMGFRDVKFGPGGQPIIPFHDPTAPKPILNEMSGPLRAVSDALDSIIENDSKLCVQRMLCEQAATNDQIQNSPLMQTALRVFQYIPLLQRTAAINALPLANSVGIISMAMRFGAMSRNESACQHRYPQCPDDPEERTHYFNNHRGGIFRFFRGNDQHQYTATELHNQLLQLGLKPQPNLANTYGFYQPTYGSIGEQQAIPYLFYNGFQTPSASEQYGLGQQSLLTSSQNSYGLYHNQIGNQYSKQQSSSIYGPACCEGNIRRFNYNSVDFKSNRNSIDKRNKIIQRRIQNKPETFSGENNYAETKWTFPKFESTIINNHRDLNNVRGGRQLKFPYERNVQETVKQFKGFSFSGAQSNRQYAEFPGEILADDDIRLDDASDADAAEGIPPAVDDQGYDIVYIVRGNGDPRKPEIVKLRPGEKI